MHCSVVYNIFYCHFKLPCSFFKKNISSLQETLFMRSLWHPEIQRQTNHNLTPYLCLKLNTSLTSHLDSVAMLTEPESECRNSLDGRSKSTQQLLANTWPLNNFKTENCLNSSVKTFIRDSYYDFTFTFQFQCSIK